MHPAIYSALADARDTELRSAGREPRSTRRRRAATPMRRLAGVAAAAAVVVAGAIVVSDSSAASTANAAASAAGPAHVVRFDGPTIAQPGQFGWQAQCPANR
jgi:hypothetical protein